MTVLLDANVLIALLVEDHVHHDAAENWLAGISGSFATCPITQGSLMRLLIREGQPASVARAILNGTATDPRHEFCPDDVPYTNVPTEGIIGHRQVTDAYLAQLARAHGFRLATFTKPWRSFTTTWPSLFRTANGRMPRPGQARGSDRYIWRNAPPCRHHHRCKQAEGWQLAQPEPGLLIWRTPAGRSYATGPTTYPA